VIPAQKMAELEKVAWHVPKINGSPQRWWAFIWVFIFTFFKSILLIPPWGVKIKTSAFVEFTESFLQYLKSQWMCIKKV